MSSPVVVLGATGSIGTQTLQVATSLGIQIAGLAARRPSPEFATIVGRHPDAAVAVAGGSAEDRESFSRLVGRKVSFGSEEVLALAAMTGTTVVNGIVGAVGLRSSMAAIEAGNRLALANKESLVAGGPVLKKALAVGGELIPVDSEHSALYQCLIGEKVENVGRLVLTASGGPFRGRSAESLAGVTPKEALQHPTWEMGRRITVDSATLFNKGLEIIEAHFLFDVPYERIDVVVHPQSVVHSVVEFVDGSWKGHIGHPDMRIPIQYALTAPDRAPSPAPRFEMAGLTLEFEAPDRETFPAIDIAFEAGRLGGSAPAVLNAADEVAVDAFLQGRLGFLGISEVVKTTLAQVEWRALNEVEDVVDVDREARSTASNLIASVC
ncbi:MAG: 1-deoxy-D-xylulose-5-phosphate reductoisomerase [Acidimicrobiia bacterium]